MARGELAPEPWASEMVAAGHVSPRTKLPSITQLAGAADLGPSTVHRLITGKGHQGQPEAATVTKLATALKIDPEVVYARLGGTGAFQRQKPKSLEVAGMDILEQGDWVVLEAVTKRLVHQRRRVIQAEAEKLIGTGQ
ncbi:hypothetical protein [Nocardia sp. NPDC004722]